MRRDQQVHLRVTVKEARRFKRLAAHYDIGVAALIRMLVKKEALRIKGAKENSR
jgi:hypothetical protein